MKIARTLISLVLVAVPNLCAALTSTSTTLSSSLNPSTYGQSVTFTAVVTSSLGAPPDGETITFLQGKNVRGTGMLSAGSASFSISTLATGGTDSIKAVYGGDSNFASSTSNVVSQVVDKATTNTALVSSQNPSAVGQSVTFTATVATQFGGTPTGNVVFNNGSTKLGMAAISGAVASFSTTKLGFGSNSITAVYNGSPSFNTSTSNTLTQTVGNGSFIDSTMTWDGVTRYYAVYVPVSMPANPAMVLMLHGTKFNVAPTTITHLNWGWQSVADKYGFILVQPVSTYNPASQQWNWDAYFMDAAFPSPPPDDSGFLRQLIVNLKAQYSVNPKQVYVAGFSSGAQMAERVGVELSDLVAAISPASGQLAGQQVPPPGLPPTPPQKPISVQEWHGTADTNLWPCNYGTTKYSGVTFTLDTVDDTFNYWTQQNACTVLQTTQALCTNNAPTPGMSGNVASSCGAGNVEVQFIWEPNVAHSFQQQNDTARWLFFAAHPKP
jgi:poly(hydroxyalkanoate) depolymerase family esterase